MEKIKRVSEKVLGQLPFSYLSARVYVDFAGYQFERHGTPIIVVQDVLYPHDFPSLFLPINPLDWERASMMFCTQADKQRIEKEGIPLIVDRSIGMEFFYKTHAFVEPTGSFKSKIQRLLKTYEFQVTNTCDPDRINAFYEKWKAQRTRDGVIFEESEQFFEYCLAHLEEYGIQQVYVEVDGELVGFGWGVMASRGGWIGLHLKVDYAYKGLSRFIHHERAKLFADTQEFTLGTGAQEQGIEEYKRELHPCREVEYFYILTGEKGEQT